jgi:hypothetical protein
MPEPLYRVFIRVPIPRGDFVDPPPVRAPLAPWLIELDREAHRPQVDWDASKDDALWKILSKVSKTQINCTCPPSSSPVTPFPGHVLIRA